MAHHHQTYLRLAALLCLSVGSGLLAVSAGSARAGKAIAAPLAPLQVTAAPVPGGASQRRCPLPAQLRPAFVRAARDTALPLSLLVAVGRVESSLRVDARSSAGARGLLQLMPATAASLQLDPDQPSSNVLAGARYLRMLLDEFGSSDVALAAYNAGPTAVAQAGGFPSAGVETYVANVTAQWRSLAGCA